MKPRSSLPISWPPAGGKRPGCLRRPGRENRHIAQMMENRGQVIAADRDDKSYTTCVPPWSNWT
ncbi:MAG: hypothetical protein R2874_09560 [Desulfobacterales bacterium]